MTDSDMRYVRVFADQGGASRFEDVSLEGSPRLVVEGVPPLLLSGPFPVTEVLFAEQPADAPDWQAHVAPRRQWIVVLSGRATITTTDGERREFGPGDVVLVEDTTGEGHVSTPLTADFHFAMIPLA
jgi:quercetin dioxygenase-like cupin family protein